jgi:GNAT superfamily N-acetyltransferase
MDLDGILELYDLHERREARVPGWDREETPHVVRLLDPLGKHSMVSWTSLDGVDADDAIRGELAYFRKLGQGFEWKLYSHDRPPDLKERLRSSLFEIGDDEAIMVLELPSSMGPAAPPSGCEIRRVEDPSLLGDLVQVERAVWGEDSASYVEDIAVQLRESPEYLSLYIAYADGIPVSAARINFPAASPFASLWGGSTRKEYRGRGIYGALLALRMREAIERGFRFLTIDASPMSRPIVERQGFRLLSVSNPCTVEAPLSPGTA